MHERISLDELRRRRQSLLRQMDAPLTHAERFFQVLGDDERLPVAPRLRFPSRMSHAHTLVLHGLADWQHTPRELRFFAALLVESLRKPGIPLYVGRADDVSVSIGHVVYGYELTPAEWSFLAAAGRRISESRGLGVSFKGKGEWRLLGVEAQPLVYGEPVRRSPRGLLADYRGAL